MRPHRSVAELVRRLTAEHGRLDALSVGDLDVRASIGLSYQALGHAHQQLIRRLALLWMPNWPAWVADELSAGSAEPVLDELVNVHLLEPLGVDALGRQRYRLHDLIAEFARERALAEESADDLDRMTDDILGAWLGLASVADDASGHGYEYGTDLLTGQVLRDPWAMVRAAAADWFEVERITLVAAVGRACRLGRADLAGALALRLAGFLRVRGHRDDHIFTLREALAAVRPGGHDRLRLRLAQALFSAFVDHDLDAEMSTLMEEMLAWARALDEPDLLIRALLQAGLYAKRRGRLKEAAGFYEQSLAACGDTSPFLLATALSSAALIYTETGRPQEALPLSERAVAVQRTAGAPAMTAMRLLIHAEVLADLGRLAESETALAEAMALHEAVGHEAAQAYAQVRLGDLAMRRGQWEVADSLIRRALGTFERLGDAGSAAYALRSLGDLALAHGRPREALEPLRRALDTWQRLRLPLEAARLHARIERAHGAQNIEATVSDYQPDYLLVLLGINDLSWGISDPAGTEESLRSFIANARTANPRMRFVFGSLLPNQRQTSDSAYAAAVADYNSRLASTVASLSTPDSPMVIADDGADFVPATDTWDGTHPNAQGEIKIAAAFADALADKFYDHSHGPGFGVPYPRPYPVAPIGPQTAPVLTATAGDGEADLTWSLSGRDRLLRLRQERHGRRNRLHETAVGRSGTGVDRGPAGQRRDLSVPARRHQGHSGRGAVEHRHRHPHGSHTQRRH